MRVSLANSEACKGRLTLCRVVKRLSAHLLPRASHQISRGHRLQLYLTSAPLTSSCVHHLALLPALSSASASNAAWDRVRWRRRLLSDARVELSPEISSRRLSKSPPAGLRWQTNTSAHEISLLLRKPRTSRSKRSGASRWGQWPTVGYSRQITGPKNASPAFRKIAFRTSGSS
jgi:hypothetical protein